MKLYDYYRSSAAYRVRIALNLKGLSPEREFVHLRKGAQRGDEFLGLNPHGLVPVLVTDEGLVLTQSLAIIEYLDETVPSPPLMPRDAAGRARVRPPRCAHSFSAPLLVPAARPRISELEPLARAPSTGAPAHRNTRRRAIPSPGDTLCAASIWVARRALGSGHFGIEPFGHQLPPWMHVDKRKAISESG